MGAGMVPGEATRTDEVETLAAGLSEGEAQRLVEEEAAARLRARREGADAELAAMTLALVDQRARAEVTLTLLAAAQSAEAQLDDRLAAALLDRLALEERLSEAGSETADLRADLIAAQAETARMREALAAAEAERARLTAALADARSGSENQAEALTAAEARIGTLTDDLTRANSEARELSAALEQARAGIDAGEAAAAEAAARASFLDTALQQAQAETARLAALVAEGDAARDSNTARLAEAQQTIDQLATDLATAREEIMALSAEAEALRAETGDADAVRQQLAAALAARLAAESQAENALSRATQRAALLDAANRELAQRESESAESQRRLAVLNEQVAALRQQLGTLQSLLDAADARDVASAVEIEALGTRLNTALAQVASEQRRRADLEAAERARLEEEARRLAEEAQDLATYRSEFFGTLRQLLGGREGIQIEGDRFVFSSEVLFPPGGATLSPAGQAQIERVAGILQEVSGDIPEGIDWVIRVDGHTDNIPLTGGGRFADNWELSQARSLSVVRYMTQELGFPSARLAANGFGEYQPVNTADTVAARAQNRRIELKLTER